MQATRGSNARRADRTPGVSLSALSGLPRRRDVPGRLRARFPVRRSDAVRRSRREQPDAGCASAAARLETTGRLQLPSACDVVHGRGFARLRQAQPALVPGPKRLRGIQRGMARFDGLWRVASAPAGGRSDRVQGRLTAVETFRNRFAHVGGRIEDRCDGRGMRRFLRRSGAREPMPARRTAVAGGSWRDGFLDQRSDRRRQLPVERRSSRPRSTRPGSPSPTRSSASIRDGKRPRQVGDCRGPGRRFKLPCRRSRSAANTRGGSSGRRLVHAGTSGGDARRSICCFPDHKYW